MTNTAPFMSDSQQLIPTSRTAPDMPVPSWFTPAAGLEEARSGLDALRAHEAGKTPDRPNTSGTVDHYEMTQATNRIKALEEANVALLAGLAEWEKRIDDFEKRALAHIAPPLDDMMVGFSADPVVEPPAAPTPPAVPAAPTPAPAPEPVKAKGAVKKTAAPKD